MKKENAYMTVEAALLFPFLTGAILFVVYMLLFQYDRCLLEQDMGALALWGSLAQATEAETLEEKVQKRVADVYDVEIYRPGCVTGEGEVYRKGSGSRFFPL